MTRRFLRSVLALAVVVAVVVGAVEIVRASNGDFSGAYPLKGSFARAGEGLDPGSQVDFRGVQVGRVSSISLVKDRALVTVLIDPGFKVPADATATVAPVNLFGAEQVTLTTPHAPGASDTSAGPYLKPGGTFAHTATSDELGDLFRAAAPLLERVDTQNLSAVVSDLAQASDGEGPRIARSIGAGASLAAFLNKTLAAQLAALDSFSRFSAAIAPDGAAINGISAAENVALPVFNQDVAYYKQIVANLTPFAAEMAQLLRDYHPDIATLLAAGDNVARVLLARQTDLGDAVAGAYQYAYKVGHGASHDVLPDGSRFAYFNTFILFTDVNSLVCDLLAPNQPGLSFLEPLQQAVAGAGTPFTCQSQLAAFNAAQAAAPSASPTAAPSTSGASAASSAAASVAQQAYGIVGQPTKGASGSVGGYVSSLLGGAL